MKDPQFILDAKFSDSASWIFYYSRSNRKPRMNIPKLILLKLTVTFILYVHVTYTKKDLIETEIFITYIC